jgi:hypothetical protein
VAQAATDARTALDLAAGVRGGLRAGRIAGRLRRLRTAFAYLPNEPAAVDWIAAYDHGTLG